MQKYGVACAEKLHKSDNCVRQGTSLKQNDFLFIHIIQAANIKRDPKIAGF